MVILWGNWGFKCFLHHGFCFLPFQHFQTKPNKGPDHQVNLRKVHDKVHDSLRTCKSKILKVSTIIIYDIHIIMFKSVQTCWNNMPAKVCHNMMPWQCDQEVTMPTAEVQSFVSRTHRSEWWRTICGWRCSRAMWELSSCPASGVKQGFWFAQLNYRNWVSVFVDVCRCL